jgi:hypothetical protein
MLMHRFFNSLHSSSRPKRLATVAKCTSTIPDQCQDFIFSAENETISESQCNRRKKNRGKFFLPKLTVCEKIAQSVFALLFFQSSTNVPINKAAPLQFVLQYLNENSQSKQSPKRRKVSLSQKD